MSSAYLPPLGFGGDVVDDIASRLCDVRKESSVADAVTKCLQKGAVETAYAVLLAATEHSLMPPDDEPPAAVCYVDMEELASRKELYSFFEETGTRLERVTIIPGGKGEEDEEKEGGEGTVLVASTFAVILKGRRTGALYVYVFGYKDERGWYSVPVVRPWDEAFHRLYLEKCR